MGSSLELCPQTAIHSDVVALAEEPSLSGCLVEVRPIGILNTIDQEHTDQRVLAVSPIGVRSSTFSQYIRNWKAALRAPWDGRRWTKRAR